MCVTICGKFCPDEGVVAGYDNRIRVKYTAKWGVQIAGMIFQTRSRSAQEILNLIFFKISCIDFWKKYDIISINQYVINDVSI